MSVLRAVVIEDEMDARNFIIDTLEKECEGVKVVGEAGGIKSGLRVLDNVSDVHVLFLDVRVEDGLSFELLEKIENINFEVVFITAYEEYAIKAFQHSAVGYILKPIDKKELKDKVEEIKNRQPLLMQNRIDLLQNQYKSSNFDRLSISATDGIYFVEKSDIVRLEGEDNYTHIYLNEGKKITVSKTIKEYEKLLTPGNFYRVHKSHIVNLKYMKKFVRGDGGYLIMEDGIEITVSRRRKTDFLKILKDL